MPVYNLFSREYFILFKNFVMHLFVCVCVQMCIYMFMDILRSEIEPAFSWFSLHKVGPGPRTQVFRLGFKSLYPLSHLNGPNYLILIVFKRN